MHLGSLVTLSENVKKNFFYFLLDNQTHESVGNQSTSSKKIDFRKFSKSFKFQKFYEISSNTNLDKILKKIFRSQKLTFVHARLSSNNKLIRPKNLKLILVTRKEFCTY